jgi:hypothetical protein
MDGSQYQQVVDRRTICNDNDDNQRSNRTRPRNVEVKKQSSTGMMGLLCVQLDVEVALNGCGQTSAHTGASQE